MFKVPELKAVLLKVRGLLSVWCPKLEAVLLKTRRFKKRVQWWTRPRPHRAAVLQVLRLLNPPRGAVVWMLPYLPSKNLNNDGYVG